MSQASETKAAPPLRLSRVLHARRQTVFQAWTSTEHIKHWFSPETFIVPEATVEPRVGGKFDVSMRGPDGTLHWIRGSFEEIVPDTRLVIAMKVTNSTGHALFRADTEINFSDALGGTQIDIMQTYTVIDPEAAWMVEGAPQGWGSTLDKLEAEVIGMQGGAATVARAVAHGTFHLERTYDAPASRVWQALTDPSAKQKWFAGPSGKWEQLERQMDVRVGGRERLRGRWDGGTVSDFDATYLDVVPHERLIYSYTMHLDDKKISVSLACMQLHALGSKTTLKLTEQGAFLDGYDDAGSREQGSAYLLDALGASLKE